MPTRRITKEQLVASLQPTLKQIAAHFNIGSPEGIDDMVSEMNIRIWTALGKKTPAQMGNARAYLLKTGYNAAVSWLRSRRRNYTHRNKVEHISFDWMVSMGFQLDAEGEMHDPDADFMYDGTDIDGVDYYE